MKTARQRAPIGACLALASSALFCACSDRDDYDYVGGDRKSEIELWDIPWSGIGVPVAYPPPADFPDSGGWGFPSFDAGVPDENDDDGGVPTYAHAERAIFDPSEVYLFGTLGTLSESACERDAVAAVSRPDQLLVGFGCYARSYDAVIRPTDGRMLYGIKGNVYAFHCDGCEFVSAGDVYPDDPERNDEKLSRAPCPTDLDYNESFVVSSTGQTLHRCGNAGWYDTSGTEVASLANEIAPHLGVLDTALVEGGVVDLRTGKLSPFVGFVDPRLLAIRNRDDGYWIALQPAGLNATPELWHVALNGNATKVGQYPSPPAHQEKFEQAKLDGKGRLVQLARDDRDPFRETIVRRSLEGASTLLYDEGENPLIKIRISSLFTGP